MRQNLVLVTFAEEILQGKLHFFVQWYVKVVLVYEHVVDRGTWVIGEGAVVIELKKFRQTCFETLLELLMAHAYFDLSTPVYLIISKDLLYFIRGY